MWKKLKKPLLVLLIFFAIYVVITSPAEAASIVQQSIAITGAALQSVYSFFDQMLKFLSALLS